MQFCNYVVYAPLLSSLITELLIKEEIHLFTTCMYVYFRKKKCKQPLESKRQRLSRNKRGREQKELAKKGLIALINGLNEEN